MVNAPSIAELVHDIHLAVHHIDSSLVSDVVESDDTVRDSLGFDQLNPSDLSGVVTMSTTASLGVDTLDIDNSELVSWNHTTLVEIESVLLLSLSLVHEALADVDALADKPVCAVLDLLFLRTSQGLVVSDV